MFSFLFLVTLLSSCYCDANSCFVGQCKTSDIKSCSHSLVYNCSSCAYTEEWRNNRLSLVRRTCYSYDCDGYHVARNGMAEKKICCHGDKCNQSEKTAKAKQFIVR
ncbi:unnamed protein product [Dicrocoelium dendriticum]|nr:unnamed protein product [Dicrocoelium dendriticum]